MPEQHEHYQQLAVGHVLGGLGPSDAADFRTHLLGCRDCRARVAELRSIASDLERAERDERARGPLATELEAPAAEERPRSDDRPQRFSRRHITAVIVLGVALVGALAFWNLHLRTSNALVGTAAEQQGRVLEVLAGGVALDVAADHPVRGLAATDGEQLAMSLVGIDPPGESERLLVWVHGEDGPAPVGEIRSTRAEDGTASLVVDAEGAEALEVRRQAGSVGDQPVGERIARVELSASDRGGVEPRPDDATSPSPGSGPGDSGA